MSQGTAEQLLPSFDDPRLVGWVPEVRYWFAADQRLEITEVKRQPSDGLFGQGERLLVYFDIVEASGERTSAAAPFYYERPRKVDLRTLRGLFEYAKSLPNDIAADRHLIRGAEGPSVRGWVVQNARLTADNLEQLAKSIDDVAAGGLHPYVALSLSSSLAQAAYALGRQVREDELLVFEWDAARGQRDLRDRQSGAEIGNRTKRQKLHDWATHAVDLVPSILAKPPPEGEPAWDLGLLAHEIFDEWKLAGKKPRPSTIKTYLIAAKEAGETRLAGVD